MGELEEYKKMLSELIKKQIVMLGPSVALGKARKVTGLKVDDQGNVTEIEGNPQTALKGLAQAYMEISAQIAQNTIDALLSKYPGIQRPS